ncbi:MAG: ABC transporter ATP-binding protein [Actinomycetota bacterium]|nr:ABC transporter ATP-binding protein [Actinomycetota bacterium]
MIVLEGVSRRFDGLAAVDGVSLEIAPGEFFSLLGPSGCGKTTTLRMIAGFEEPDEGRVLLDGEDVTHLSPKRRNVNMVFQDYALFPHMTVADNIGFGPRLKGVARDEIAARIEEMIGIVRLEGMADRRPGELSGGQRQRVALARALVNRPAALLLDEPLGALDLKLRREMQHELKRIQKSTGTTFVYVTHDQEEALTMSDRIAVMNRGRVEQVDAPETVYERPSTTFVAGFIGVSNLMPAVVEQSAGERTRVCLDAGVEIEAAGNGLVTGERCHAVVRPEKLRIDRKEDSTRDGWPSVEGTVESSVYLGTATQIVVRLAGDVPMTVLVPNADDAERNSLPGGGADVRLSWAPGHIHLVKESNSTQVEETITQ